MFNAATGGIAIFRFFCGNIFTPSPVRNARHRPTALASGSLHAGRKVGACALYGHFCKIDRIGASSRRVMHVIGTSSFI